MRLIDVDALPTVVGRQAELPGLIVKAIQDAPTIDAVPVVRCKDCKYSRPWYADKYLCYIWSETGVDVFNDGFCSYGERKDSNV